MHRPILNRCALQIAAAVTVVVCDGARANASDEFGKVKLHYPISQSWNDSHTYHGQKIADPYSWLEDLKSKETKAWISQQNALTRSVLDQLPARKVIYQRLAELMNHDRCSIPNKCGEHLFFFKRRGLQNQSVFYVQKSGAEPKILVDPNLLSADGTTSMNFINTTSDGKRMLYSLKKEGAGTEEYHVKDVDSGIDLPDHLTRLAYPEWSKDGKGFYYYRYFKRSDVSLFVLPRFRPAVRRNISYHVLGTPQSADRTVYQRSSQRREYLRPVITEDGHYLVISVFRKTIPGSRLIVLNLQDSRSKPQELVSDNKSIYNLIGNQDNKLYFGTNSGAPNGKVVSIQLENGALTKPVEIVPETENTLETISLVRDNLLVCNYIKDASNVVEVRDLSGKFIRQLSIPGEGSVSGISGLQSDKVGYFSYSNYTIPSTIFSINWDDFSEQIFFQPKRAFNPDDFTTERIFYTSKDGAKIPMSISYKKGLKKNGRNPTYLYGYGGFGVSLLPSFNIATIAWMERGGIYAVPNLRGGGEFGDAWHLAGTKHKKQMVFNDFIAAAQALIDQKYTSAEHLAIGGSSNGGLLVGACMTQRPDLFAAAVPSVGVMDMLRLKRSWIQEYGSAKDEADFSAMMRYSPLHNLKSGVCYPATLVFASDNDDHVQSWQSYKFAAALQNAQGCDKPTLIRIDSKIGHGNNAPATIIIDETADQWAFLEQALTGKSE